MALLMLAFERQSGNVETAFSLIPYAPGCLPTLILHNQLQRLIDFPLGATACLGFSATAAFLVVVAALGRLGREWLVGGTVAAFFINAIAAYWLSGAIRM